MPLFQKNAVGLDDEEMGDAPAVQIERIAAVRRNDREPDVVFLRPHHRLVCGIPQKSATSADLRFPSRIRNAEMPRSSAADDRRKQNNRILDMISHHTLTAISHDQSDWRFHDNVASLGTKDSRCWRKAVLGASRRLSATTGFSPP